MILSLSFDKAGTVKGFSLLPIHGYRFIFNMMSDLTADGRTRAGVILVLSDRRDDGPRSNRPVAIGRADPGCGVRVAKQAHKGAQDALRAAALDPDSVMCQIMSDVRRLEDRAGRRVRNRYFQ